MFKVFFTLLIAFLWTFSVVAQDAKDVYTGVYQNQVVQQGQNIPLNYDGPLATLHDNGPLATHPGGGSGGADASALQTALGMGTYGYGHQISAGNSIADDFTNTEEWTVEEMRFYAYQTGSSTTSTINDIRVQVYDGDPSAGGTVIFGDLTTNVLSGTGWSNIYRVLDTDLLASTRPIMENVVTLGTPLVLPAGTYWIEWQTGGTLTSGPWAPPVTVLGSTGTGNALQNTGTWAAVTDVGPQDFPFLVLGTSGSGGLDFFDDFDSYTAGVQLCLQTTEWETWTNTPGSGEDPFVSTNYAYSGANSVVVIQNNDFVRRHGPQTTGTWYMSFLFYIDDAAKSGYFNTMNAFAPDPNVWGMDAYFDVGGVGRLDTTGGGGGNPAVVVPFTWTVAAWNQVVVIVDLDATPTEAQFWIGTSQSNFTQIATWDFTQAGTKPTALAVNDFFGAAATDEMYIDNYYFQDVLPPIIPVELTSFAANVNNNGQVVLNWATATELNNLMFEIQRASEGNEFHTIGYVNGAGTTTEPQQYSYLDATVNTGAYSYRLKNVDYDGRSYYSDVVEVEVVGPLTFALEQNYPNPFNPSTNIKFSVPKAGDIKLAVYNIVGEEVAVLVDGVKEAGFYNVTFDATSLPSGVYLYKLQSANSVETKKMMLLK